MDYIEEMKKEYERGGFSPLCFPNLIYRRNGNIDLELNIWSIKIPGHYKRFLLSKENPLSFEDKLLFDKLCRDEKMHVDTHHMERIYKIFVNERPEIHLDIYNKFMHMSHHIYCTMHRGAEEILYKANLGYLGLYLGTMEDYNLIGTTPTAIFDGLPLYLLRKLNTKIGAQILKTEVSRSLIYDLYMNKPELFSNVWTVGQSMYFLDVILKKQEFGYEDYCMLRYLKGINNRGSYKKHVIYSQQIEKLKQYNFYMQSCPPISKRTALYVKANLLYDYLVRKKDIYTEMYEKEYEDGGQYLEYTDGKYMMVWPKKYADICLEAENQKNCLLDYIEEVVNGETKIFFMRKVEAPNESYITVEIQDNEICQALGERNRSLTKEEYSWLEDYAYEMGLFIDEEVFFCDYELQPIFFD